MKSISNQIVRLYQELADHTLSDCNKHCTQMGNCCDAAFCEIARNFAKSEYGVELGDTGHPALPFMGPTGCTVPPHLRPRCTEFVCCIRDHREKPGNPEWTMRYYSLRQQILFVQIQEKKG